MGNSTTVRKCRDCRANVGIVGILFHKDRPEPAGRKVSVPEAVRPCSGAGGDQRLCNRYVQVPEKER